MLRQCSLIQIFFPLEAVADVEWPISEARLVEATPSLGRVLQLLRSSAPIGQIGHYTGVFEISVGLEGFTPTKGANPTLGDIQNRTDTPSVCLTTYAITENTSLSQIEAFIGAVVKLHSWEHPIIELREAVHLWFPDHYKEKI
jgi:hypothetical protein